MIKRSETLRASNRLQQALGKETPSSAAYSSVMSLDGGQALHQKYRTEKKITKYSFLDQKRRLSGQREIKNKVWEVDEVEVEVMPKAHLRI